MHGSRDFLVVKASWTVAAQLLHDTAHLFNQQRWLLSTETPCAWTMWHTSSFDNWRAAPPVQTDFLPLGRASNDGASRRQQSEELTDRRPRVC
jgi:hypothetical protein